MAFSCRIVRSPDPADDCHVEVPLLVSGSNGILGHPFRLDTGCGITIVRGAVARAMGLHPRGRPFFHLFVPTGGGRLVPARFRFPSDPVTGAPGREVASEWLVIPVTYEYAHLGMRDVHPHFTITTSTRRMHFTDRA